MASRNISARRAGPAGIDGTDHRLKTNSPLSGASRVRPTYVDLTKSNEIFLEGRKEGRIVKFRRDFYDKF